jgi:hypothetical protein
MDSLAKACDAITNPGSVLFSIANFNKAYTIE